MLLMMSYLKRKQMNYFLCILLMLMSVQVKAQKVQLKGSVTTEDGTILPGVTIAVNKQDEKKNTNPFYQRKGAICNS